MNRILGFVFAILFLLSGCSAAATKKVESTPEIKIVQGTGTMVIRDTWMRPASQGANGAIYFTIGNYGKEYDELIQLSSDAAEAIEIHVSRMSGDVMSMHHVEAMPLVAGEEVAFTPGGLHIMLVGLRQDLSTGDAITVTLQFKKHQKTIITVPVQETYSDPTEDALQRLERARQKWQEANITHYRFRLNIQCICLASQYAPLIEVQNGEIVSMKLAEGSDVEEYSLQEVRDMGTIDKLFDLVEGVLRTRDADVFSVKYEETYGFPSYYRDWDIDAIDDESRVFVLDFEILP